MSLKEFVILSKLGEGAYSSVYKVRRIVDDQIYALKKVKLKDLNDKEKQNALNEVQILASIRSPYVVSYKEVFLTETSCTLCIIMEYLDNGDLFQKITKHQSSRKYFKEDEIFKILNQLVQGLQALHNMKILHRDIKSANVFLNQNGQVKLGDMNVSKVAKKGLLKTQTGTPYYASPEVWQDKSYDYKSDIWSLGCVLYEMCALKPPFRGEDMEDLFKKVTKGNYPRIPVQYSNDLNNVIKQLLMVNSANRPNCQQILTLIQQKLDDYKFFKVDENQQLLSTIRVPQQLHFLTDQLPKANYNSLKLIQIDKNIFFQSQEEQLSNRLPQIKNNTLTSKNEHITKLIDKQQIEDIHKIKLNNLTNIYGKKLHKKIHKQLEKINVPSLPKKQDIYNLNIDTQHQNKVLRHKLQPLNI